jgi:hypothetical protein
MNKHLTFVAIAVISSCIHTAPAVGQEAEEQAVIDFDSVLPINEGPLRITIYASNQPSRHIYYVLPNSIQVAIDKNGEPMIGVLHYGRLKKKDTRGGFFSVSLHPVIDSELALQSIRKWDPSARFVMPVPVVSKLTLRTNPKFVDGIEESPPSDPSSAPGLSAFTLNLTPLGTRVFLTSTIEKSNFLVAEYTFRLRGVQRDPAATFVERQFSYGLSFSVSCTQYPKSYVNTTNRDVGCLKPKKHWWQRRTID